MQSRDGLKGGDWSPSLLQLWGAERSRTILLTREGESWLPGSLLLPSRTVPGAFRSVLRKCLSSWDAWDLQRKRKLLKGGLRFPRLFLSPPWVLGKKTVLKGKKPRNTTMLSRKRRKSVIWELSLLVLESVLPPYPGLISTVSVVCHQL